MCILEGTNLPFGVGNSAAVTVQTHTHEARSERIGAPNSFMPQ